MILLVNGDKLLESDMFTEEQKKFIKEQEIWTKIEDKLPNESVDQCLCLFDTDFVMTLPYSAKYRKFNVRDKFTEDEVAQCEVINVRKWMEIK